MLQPPIQNAQEYATIEGKNVASSNPESTGIPTIEGSDAAASTPECTGIPTIEGNDAAASNPV